MSSTDCPKCGYPNVPSKPFKGIYTPGKKCSHCGYLGPALEKKLPYRATEYSQKRKVMEQILGVWAANPDLRLGQLLINASMANGNPDIFYEEDLTLTQKVIDYGKKVTVDKAIDGSHSLDDKKDGGG